jgi:hypothetical protein
VDVREKSFDIWEPLGVVGGEEVDKEKNIFGILYVFYEIG